MHTNRKQTLSEVANYQKSSKITISRLAKADPSFPITKFGRSIFIDSAPYFKWLSKKAGQTITPDDVLLKGNDVQNYYSKSQTWIWANVKAGNLPKPFKINRCNYWLERDIVGEVGEVA